MRRLATVILGLVSLSSFAQSVDINLGGLTAGVRITGPGPSPTAAAPARRRPAARAIGAENFRLTYETNPQTRLIVTEPEGYRAEVWSEDDFEGDFVVPFSFEGRSGQYYRVIVVDGSGVPVLDRKVELREYHQVTLSALSAQIVVTQPSRPSREPSMRGGPMPMSPTDFNGLLEAVRTETFASDKLGVIRQAVNGGAWFTCAQVGELVERLTMSSEKVEVVSITRSQIVDPNNAFTLQKRFTFSGDKEKVRALFGS